MYYLIIGFKVIKTVDNVAPTNPELPKRGIDNIHQASVLLCLTYRTQFYFIDCNQHYNDPIILTCENYLRLSLSARCLPHVTIVKELKKIYAQACHTTTMAFARTMFYWLTLITN